MSDEPAEGILDSARYLRNVRPIDPEELVDYVDGEVGPNTVRDVLRRHAVDLALREREDGTFVPVEDEPIDVTFDRVDALPAEYVDRVTELLRTEYGERWYDGESGTELREAIRAFKRAYFAGEPVAYDRATALGYAIYHLPATYASVQYVLDELGSAGLLGSRLRVLDVGAGVGGGAVALREYLPPGCLLDYTAVEPSEPAADVLAHLMADAGPTVQWDIERTTIEAASVAEEYDVILAANVLSELDRPASVLARLGDALAENGALVAIAPADERTSRPLRRVETDLLRERPDLDVFSPTLRLWPGEQPTDDCWAFDVRPDLAVPGFQRALDEGRPAAPDEHDPATGEFVNVDLRYSYSIVRADGRRRIGFEPSRNRRVPLAESPEHVTDRVAVAVAKLSHSLADEDANPLFVVGDGSQATEHFAVLTNETRLNRHLREAAYGEVLLIQGALLLWNEDEAAYNLVVDAETVIDRVTSTGIEVA